MDSEGYYHSVPDSKQSDEPDFSEKKPEFKEFNSKVAAKKDQGWA